MTVFVLWEDNAISPISKFGPHVFLIACVAARLGTNRYELARSERIDGRPCAGNSKLFLELKRGPLWDSGEHVVAVLDTDEIHDRLPGIRARRTIADGHYEAWRDSVVSEIRKRAPDQVQHRLDICMLDANLETLLSLVGHGALGLDEALRKDRLHRDKLLHRAASDDELVRRACAQMPSWEQLVETVARILSARSTTPAPR